MSSPIRNLAASSLVLLAGLLGSTSPSQAQAAFGDDFGLADINVPGAQSTPVFDDASGVTATSAFWAGTCETGLAPPPPAFLAPPPTLPYPPGGIANPAPTPIPGGIGSRPHNVWIPQTTVDGQPADESNPDKQQASGPAPRYPDQCGDWGGLEPYGNADHPELWFVRDGSEATFNRTPKWRLPAVTQAGAHPDGSTTMWFRRIPAGAPPPHQAGFVEGAVDNIYAQLPAGFIGNPTAVPKCTAEQFAIKPVQCPPESQVGVLHLFLVAPGASGATYTGSTEELLPVYNLEPRQGKVAEFGITYVSNEDATTARIVAKARTNGDFGVDAFVAQLPAALPVIAQAITLWGVPWDSTHDMWRPPTGWRPHPFATGEMPPTGLIPADRVGYDRDWGPIKPLLSNPTECSGQNLNTRVLTDSYEHPGGFTAEGDPDLAPLGGWKVYDSQAPPVTGCEKVPFGISIDPQPSSTTADSASGLSVDLTIPQNEVARDLDGDPIPVPPQGAAQGDIDQYVTDAMAYWSSLQGLSTSQLDTALVTLPEGVSVNPSSATGLKGCSDQQIGLVQDGTPPLFNNDDPFDGKGLDCPKESRIGTVEVDTPLLEQPLTGVMVLGTPRGTDPQATAIGARMFRVFIVVRERDRGLIAKIAGYSTADAQTGQLTAAFEKNPRVPFESMHLELKAGPRGLLALPQRCEARDWSSLFTPFSATAPVSDSGSFVTDRGCSFGFNPSFAAGSSPRNAGGSGVFTLQFARQDGEQWFRDVTFRQPLGLAGDLSDVPICTNAQASAEACPLASKIGTVDGTAGSGTPFVLETKGSVYLTEGYKGAPLGLLTSVPVEAGPFSGQFALRTIVVRQALRVDPRTAQVTVESDPLPRIWHGIPLRVRSVLVRIDRPGFIRLPTDCSPKQTAAAFTSAEGATANASSPFQVGGCENLGFKPQLKLSLKGGTKRGQNPKLKAELTARPGDANISRAAVTLPHSAFLDQAHINTVCTRVQFAVKACPAGSVYGFARAWTPLLKDPLEGPVYLRSSSNLLPDLVADLNGLINIELVGRTDSVHESLRNTFDVVPDAPVSKFVLELHGGKKGLIDNSENLCASVNRATVRFNAQNGLKRNFRPVVVAEGCKGKGRKGKGKGAKAKSGGQGKSKPGRR